MNTLLGVTAPQLSFIYRLLAKGYTRNAIRNALKTSGLRPQGISNDAIARIRRQFSINTNSPTISLGNTLLRENVVKTTQEYIRSGLTNQEIREELIRQGIRPVGIRTQTLSNIRRAHRYTQSLDNIQGSNLKYTIGFDSVVAGYNGQMEEHRFRFTTDNLDIDALEERAINLIQRWQDSALSEDQPVLLGNWSEPRLLQK